MTILLSPIVAPVSGNRQDFQAVAQITIVTCDGAGSTAIIKKPCGDGSTSPQEIIAFENDAVNAWLAAHQLPKDDGVYRQYGRMNLRNELRAYVLASIVAIIQKPASQRTPREQAVYNWMQANVKELEIQVYQAAIAEWNAYNKDRCYYSLDADIANNYGISYDPKPFCYDTSLSSAFSFPATPAPSYFLAVGLKKSYGTSLADNSQHGAAISYAVANEVSTVRAYSAAAGITSGVAAGAAVAASAASIFPYTVGFAAAAAQGLSVAATPSYIAVVTATAPLTTALATAGAGAVVALAVTIGIQAGIQAVSNQAQIDQLNALGNALASTRATQPDLPAFLLDAQGRYKLNAAFVTQTLPDTPSTDPLPQHRPGTDPNLAILPEGGTGVGGSSLEATFQDWNKNKVSITTWGGYFLHTTTSVKGDSTDVSITPTIHYLDWAGNQMTASRRGGKFLVLRNGSAQQSCPADTITEISTQSPESCSSYLTDALQLLDRDGNKVTVRISSSPVFTGPNRFSTPVNTPATAKVSVTSDGPVTEFKLVGAAPAGITVTRIDSNNFRVQFGGSAQPRGDTLTFSATNAFGTTTAKVVFTSDGQLQFTSIPTIDAWSGSSVSYKVTTNGRSSATITSTGLDQIGLTLTDNDDGTATIAGILNWPRGGTSASCEVTGIDGLCPIDVSAMNGTQTITSAIPHKIPVAISYESHQEKDLGYLPPGVQVSLALSGKLLLCFSNCSVTYTGHLPGGLTLAQTAGTNGSGIGSATLEGTPAFGSEGDYSVMISFGTSLDTMSLKFSVGAPQPPVFTSPPVAIVYLTRPMAFTVSAVGTPAPKLIAGPLPEWLTFETQQQANGAIGKLSGRPQYITGPFSLSFKAISSIGEKGQTVTVFFRVVEGDLNNDGIADCRDYQFLKDVLRYSTIHPGYTWLADHNGDGLVNIEDLSGLGRLLPGNPVCH